MKTIDGINKQIAYWEGFLKKTQVFNKKYEVFSKQNDATVRNHIQKLKLDRDDLIAAKEAKIKNFESIYKKIDSGENGAELVTNTILEASDRAKGVIDSGNFDQIKIGDSTIKKSFGELENAQKNLQKKRIDYENAQKALDAATTKCQSSHENILNNVKQFLDALNTIPRELPVAEVAKVENPNAAVNYGPGSRVKEVLRMVESSNKIAVNLEQKFQGSDVESTEETDGSPAPEEEGVQDTQLNTTTGSALRRSPTQPRLDYSTRNK
ncbi:MAG: hypothetical protein LBB21_01540 [Holosporaceae bacterium]|nr:hypothetical protein [Holosporaceae bacterium]